MFIDILTEIAMMFKEMAPYMMLGLVFVGIVHLFLSKDFVLKHIGKNNFSSIAKASIFGIPLPLCSCGVIPTTVYMAKNGASKSSTVSFLTSTPQTGVDSMIATYGMMGPVFAIFRPIAAFLMGIIGGIVTSIAIKDTPKAEPKAEPMEKKLAFELNQFTAKKPIEMPKPKLTFTEKIKKMYNYAFVEFLDDFSVHFIVGVIISGLIAYFVPADFFNQYGLNNGIVGMLMMIIIGVPMYICATASIPIAVTLMMKGFSPGVAFVFLAVGPATNAASLTVLFEAIGKKATIVYLITLIITSILFGTLLDKMFQFFDWNIIEMLPAHLHGHSHEVYLISPTVDLVIALLFLVILIMSLYRKYLQKYFKKSIEIEKANTLGVEGMTCENCAAAVNRAISNVEGVEAVKVDLSGKIAYIQGNYNSETVKESIIKAGYKIRN